jgi:hypothetical protein
MNYLVTWEIDIEADSAHDAAEMALEIQRRPDSTAIVFTVRDETGESIEVDLDDDFQVPEDVHPAQGETQ